VPAEFLLRAHLQIALPGRSIPPVLEAGDAGDVSLFKALETDLGLKLEKKKSMVDVWAIDHAAKVPVDN